MRFRTLYGIIITSGIGLLLWVDYVFFGPVRPLGSLLLTVLAALGWREYARIVGIAGSGARAHAGLDTLGAAAVLFFFAVAWSFASRRSGSQGVFPGSEVAWTSSGLLALVLLAFGLVVTRSDFERFYVPLLETITGAILLGFLFAYVLRIYHLPGWEGPILGAIFVGGVKGNDTVAYYVGKAWGKRHVFKVSPRKTLEGCVGAIIFSAVYFALAGAVVEAYRPGSLFPWSGGILFGMMMSIVSQAGDLSESLMKRVYQVKDSGMLLPEFGGVLDMIDSLLFTGFVFWQFR